MCGACVRVAARGTPPRPPSGAEPHTRPTFPERCWRIGAGIVSIKRPFVVGVERASGVNAVEREHAERRQYVCRQ